LISSGGLKAVLFIPTFRPSQVTTINKPEKEGGLVMSGATKNKPEKEGGLVMSGATKNLESFIASLCQKAKDLGASQAVATPAADIVLDERTPLKCLVPRCSHYDVHLMCPPNVLSVSEFREVLKCYHSAILIKIDIPLSDLLRSIGKGEEQPGALTVEDWMNTERYANKKLHEIVSQVESLCLKEGYYFAIGMLGGACPLCEECVGIKSGLPCRHPFKARPATEAMGIDVMATAKKVGLDLSPSQDDESMSWVGLVIVS